MTAVPAKVAGVAEVVLCVPPDRATGTVPEVTLAAAALCQVDEIYAIGGAQAIAAMAFGTESIRAVDVIVGPGNAYVAVAKREVAGRGRVAVPSAFAGPSEVVVVADETVPADYAAIDLVVQAEHGPGGLSWLLCWSEAVADQVTAAVERLVDEAPRRADILSTLDGNGYAVICDDAAQAMAVANLIAPEHLELLCENPMDLVPLVRHAGAVFCGAQAPASDRRLPGGAQPCPAHVRLRPVRVRVDRGRLRQAHPRRRGVPRRVRGGGPSCGGAGPGRGPGGARPVHPAEGATALSRPPVREDLALMEGYHSPQVDVAVRLNTNESPFLPPPEFGERLAAEIAAVEWHRYPDRAATELRAAIAKLHGVDPAMVFAANGSNEVLQTLLLTFAGPGRTVATFEPTYALHAHIAHLSGARVVSGQRDDDFGLVGAEVDRVIDEASPSVVFLCSPNNPTGVVEPPELVRATAARCTAEGRLLVVDEAYGQFAPWSAQELVNDDDPVVVTRTFSKTWSMAAARLGYLIGTAVAGRRARQGRPSVPPGRGQAGSGSACARLRRRDGGPGRHHRRGARSHPDRPGRAGGHRLAVRRQLRVVPP